MEQIRAWVLAVCFACIAAGILGQLSSSRTRFSVIKLILTLYILITAFAPLQSLGDGHVTFDIPEAPQTVQAPDTEAMVLNTVCTRLEDTVRSALAENGIAYTEVDVALGADSETVEVADVTVIGIGDPPDRNAGERAGRRQSAGDDHTGKRRRNGVCTRRTI